VWRASSPAERIRTTGRIVSEKSCLSLSESGLPRSQSDRSRFRSAIARPRFNSGWAAQPGSVSGRATLTEPFRRLPEPSCQLGRFVGAEDTHRSRAGHGSVCVATAAA